MPVGTNFENSALKASFSLSSLPPSTGLESPEHAKIKNERLYNSLTKKRKDPKQDNWRRSWGSTYDNNDFWSALQPNYDYIMDNHLIDSCKEIDQDMRAESEETQLVLNQLISEFSEIHSFLENVLEAIYGKAENVTNWALRASYMEEMSHVAPRKKQFDEQVYTFMKDVPALQDEVNWRLNHLHLKWEQVETALSSNKCSRCEKESCPDVGNEVKCLRKWVEETESRLQPLNFQVKWTLPELEKKALEHMVLHRDIENHCKIVSSVVRLCNDDTPRDPKCFASNAKRVASRLERRYHLLYLRSLEWQCHIESLVKLHPTRSQNNASDSDTDDEPCLKQPRLSADFYEYNNRTNHCDEDEDSVSIVETTHLGNETKCSIIMVNGNERHFDNELNGTSDCQRYSRNVCAMTENKYEKDQDEVDNKTTKISNSNLSPKTNKNTCTKTQHEKLHKEKNTLKKLHSATANVGSYIYEHGDTDSEMENKEASAVVLSEKEDDKMKEESSEDEFTYSKVPLLVEPVVEKQIVDAKAKSKDCIQFLVEKVEELVSSPKIDPFMFQTEHQESKQSRVKKWLNYENKEKPTDSCDASGECTSGESDEDRESESSEDFNDSIVTCRPQTLGDSHLLLNTSTVTVLQDSMGSTFSSPDSVKVHLRPRRLQMKGNRPWSVSSLSQLSQTSPIKHNDDFTNFSISESALNKLAISSPTSNKMRSFNTSANSIGVQGNNSTSSTVEESGVLALNESSKSISAKKKKYKLRKKQITRKIESGCETQTYHSTCYKISPLLPSKHNLRALVKSGSFSGCDSKKSSPERSTVSDPSGRPHNRGKGICDTSTTSGPDSEDDKKFKRSPNFLFGPREGAVKTYCSPIPKIECHDSSPEKNSLNAVEEQSSSLSEQAWDNYQEKYLSENYSEAHDSDAARRLLEFGEDYDNCLNSASDCWSAHSLHERSPQFKRKPQPLPCHEIIDSDSEIENIKIVIQKSKSQFLYTTEIFKKYVAMGLNEFLISNDCSEIIDTCTRHIYGLDYVIESNDDAMVLPDIELPEIKALMSSWLNLKVSAEKMQQSRALHNEIIALKEDFLKYSISADADNSEFKSKEELVQEIERLAADLALLQEKKRRLLELNAAVHHYVVNKEIHGGSNLKSEVSELYILFNDICQSITERSNSLNAHLQAWTQIESRLDELQSDLRSDEETLLLLDTALKGGIVPKYVAHTVRDVAKVLSESTNATQKPIAADNAPGNLFNSGIRSLSLSLLTDCSFSDSGISDEGSEEGLGGREHRLAAIRRLVRQLEAIMAPDSEARIKMTQRLEEAENELKKLQKQCRGLIVRTAVCAEVQSRENKQDDSKVTSGKLNKQLEEAANAVPSTSGDPDDYDGDEPGTKSWFWRVVRASMPFQVAIIALFCVACLLEPSCCDSLNNLNLSLTPQLRYVRGPPPV